VFRAAGGTHDDWEAYDRTMAERTGSDLDDVDVIDRNEYVDKEVGDVIEEGLDSIW
jgi:hypothetical protein